MTSRITEAMRAELAQDILTMRPLDGVAFTSAPDYYEAPTLLFRLGRPHRTRMGVTKIMFVGGTDGRIIIYGDRQPSRRGKGLVSDLGYGLGWFGRPLGGRYLCEKFLQKDFHPQIAHEWLSGFVDDDITHEDRGTTAAGLEAARRAVASGHDALVFARQESFEDFLRDELGFTDNDLEHDEGHGYEPREAGWLAAIQQRFAELLPGLVAGTSEQRFAAIAFGHLVTSLEQEAPLPSGVLGPLVNCSDAFVASLPDSTRGVERERSERAVERAVAAQRTAAK